jgi:hypothetical protein
LAVKVKGTFPSKLYIYIWSENSSPKSEAKVAEIEELLDVNFRHLGFSFLIGPDIAPDIY